MAVTKLKGFFYSISLLIILAPIIALVVYYSTLSTQTSSTGVSKAVSVEASNFINSVETDFSRALEISAKSATISAIDKVVSTGLPLANSRVALAQLAANGSFAGDNQTYHTMSYNHLAHWASGMQNLSRNYGIDSTIIVTPANVAVYSYTPFSLVFAANVSIFATSFSTLQEFNFSRTYQATAVVSIEGLEDPFYTLHSQGLIPRTFMQNASEVANVSALDAIIDSEAYVPNADAPDFFNRLEDNMTASQFGIETFVNINDFIAQDIPVRNQSMVDHVYFDLTQPVEAYKILTSTHNWFRIDCTHARYYKVDGDVDEC